MSTSKTALAVPRFQPDGFDPTDEQKVIQTCPARHVIAMANAGAGKTTTLALRIAESLARGVPPGSVVALTFSEEAARVLRTRLLEIGVPRWDASLVSVSTFEAFSARILADIEGQSPVILKTFEEAAPYVREAVETLRRRNAERRVPRELWFPEQNEQIADFLKIVRRLKAQLVMPMLENESLELRSAAVDISIEMLALYRQLENDRQGNGDGVSWRADFDATFDLACLLLRDSEMQSRLPSYRVVVVDELQDMNSATYLCLEHLKERGGSFFTGAGDFDQVIHRWAGADVTFIRDNFGSGWSSVKRLDLTKTFRHGPAMAVATGFQKGKNVTSGRSTLASIEVKNYAFGNAREAADKVVDAIHDLQKRGKRLDGCAVILRAPHQSVHVENAFLEAGIGCRVEGMKSYLLRSEVLVIRGVIAFALNDYESIPGVEKRLLVLKAMNLWQELGWSERRANELEDAAKDPLIFEEFLNHRLLKPQTLADKAASQRTAEEESLESQRLLERVALLRKQNRHHEANLLIARQQKDSTVIDETPLQRHARERLVRTLAEIRSAPLDQPAHLTLVRAVETLELKSVARRLFIDPSTANIAMRSIDGFLDAARRIEGSLQAFALWLRQAEEHSANLRKSRTVLLSTVEAAKGFEYDSVILPYLESGEFPMAGFDREEESNRFYVAITRMRDDLTLIVPNDRNVSPFVTAMKIDEAKKRGNAKLDNILGNDNAPEE